MDIQKVVDEAIEQWRKERSETQLTLGELIGVLKNMPEGARVANLKNPHSYRGYYSDLSFEYSEGTQLATDLLKVCKEALGGEFIGYKGGEFVMNGDTPLWMAYYGSCGVKIMAIHEDGAITTKSDDVY